MTRDGPAPDRPLNGDRLDVTYEEGETGQPTAVIENAISVLSDPSGALRARHGDREVVIFGRGVAAIEIEPRGAVL
jgi:hypothetical protein